MHSIQLLPQLSDPHRCPGAASRLPTDGTDGGFIIDGGTANDAEDAVQWLRARPAWRAIGFEPNPAECRGRRQRQGDDGVQALSNTRPAKVRPEWAKEASLAAEGA